MPKRRCAALTLLSLALSGLVLPTVVLFLLKPKQTSKFMERRTSTRPLDCYIVLDASISLGPSDWRDSLDFARNLSLRLNASLPDFRAGLGQFSTLFHAEIPVSQDLDRFVALPSGIRRDEGLTMVAKALCGDNAKVDCTGGAYGELMAAPPLAHEELEELEENCGELEAAKLVVLVTDGAPSDGKLAAKTAKMLKQTTNLTIMGILVKFQEDATQADKLYALTSCCPAEDMVGRKCLTVRNKSCSHMAVVQDYAALKHKVDQIVSTLTADMDCEVSREMLHIEYDKRSLWFLLLLVPLVLQQIWQKILVMISSSMRSGAVDEADGAVPDAREVQAPVAVELSEVVPAPATAELSEVSQRPSDAAPQSETPIQQDTAAASSASSGYTGKKWAPVRSAYLVGGKRIDVNFGTSGSAPPPTAPNAARRGLEEETSRDTPEAFFERTPTLPRMLSSATVHVVSFIEVPARDVAPPLRRFNCGATVPLVATLILIPFIVQRSGILQILGVVQDDPSSGAEQPYHANAGVVSIFA